MATAVRELDLTALPGEIAGLDRYERALFLVRLEDTDLLVASSPGGCSLIHTRPNVDREVTR